MLLAQTESLATIGASGIQKHNDADAEAIARDMEAAIEKSQTDAVASFEVEAYKAPFWRVRVPF